MSPLFKSTAVSRPYGGLNGSGRSCSSRNARRRKPHLPECLCHWRSGVRVPRYPAEKRCTASPLEDSMRNELTYHAGACALAVVCLAASTGAQAPAPSAQGAAAAPAAGASIVVEKPTYVSIPLEITVNRLAAEV